MVTFCVLVIWCFDFVSRLFELKFVVFGTFGFVDFGDFGFVSGFGFIK